MTRDEMRHADDEGVKLLLWHIAEDEDGHHTLLTTFVSNSCKINTQDG